MSIPEYLVSRSSLRANRPDALIGSEIVMVTKADHVAAVEAAYLGAVREGLDERERELHDGRWRAIDDCYAVVERHPAIDPFDKSLALEVIRDLKGKP